MSSLFDAIWIEMPMIPYVVMLMRFTGTNVMLGDASSELPSRDPVVELHHRRQAPGAAGSRHYKDTKACGEEGDIEAHVVACHLSASRGTSGW